MRHFSFAVTPCCHISHERVVFVHAKRASSSEERPGESTGEAMTHNQNGPAFPFRSDKQKRGPWRVVLLVLGSASFALLLVVQYWCLQSLLDDSAFLHQASASAQEIVSAVSTSVLPGGDGLAVVLCREEVTFLPAGTRPITLTSEGLSDPLWEQTRNAVSQVIR
jgi:hypothetical protein